MKLADWARAEGIHPKTAYRWFRQGRMPVPAVKVASGSILVHDPKYDRVDSTGRAVVYARVSAHDQKTSLDGQVARTVDADEQVAEAAGIDPETLSLARQRRTLLDQATARAICDTLGLDKIGAIFPSQAGFLPPARRSAPEDLIG